MTLHQKHYYRFILISICTLFYFFANIQRVAIPGAIFDNLQGDFMVSADKITFLASMMFYVYAICQLIVGIMVDKFGGFRVVTAGSIVFAIGVILFPLSNDINILYLSRALVGFGAATFYISTIREVKKFAKDKNFSLAISYILFIGYSGGIIANAPFVAVVNQIGWRDSLLYIGYFTLLITIIYLALFFIFKPVHIEKDTKLSLEPFREILKNKKNLILYAFGSINYGLYYVLQSVIGKKFLQDFCHFGVNKAAIILSFMAIVSALAGTITAYISKSIGNKRLIIYKIFGILSFISVISVFSLLFFNIHSKIIALIFCIPSFIGSISPLLILTLHCLNRYEVSATALSIQNFGFYMMVGILGMLSGILMNMFEPTNVNGVLIYSNQSYILVFGLFLILSIIEMFCAFKIKDV